MKIKILPVTILTCALFLGGKTLHMVEMSHAETTDAAEKPAAKDDKVDVVDDNKTSTKAKADPDKADEADVKKTDEKDSKDDKKDEKKGEKDAKDDKCKMPANVSYERPQENIPQFTDSEKQILQKLADRRTELDNYAKDLDLRASLVDASSKKVDTKLEELKKLKADTEAILVTYNEHEAVKIKSLVKIYENMKPTAAAGIFEQMDMDTLLEIVDKMSEKKASAVLAVMNPAKAKEVTQKLADEKSLKKQTTAPAAPKTAAAPTAPAVPTSITPPPTTQNSPPASIAPPAAGKAETPPPAQSKAAAVDNAKTDIKAEKPDADAKTAAEKPAEGTDKKSEKDTSAEVKPKA